MTTMNETEQAMLDLVVDAVDRGAVTGPEIDALLRTVRAYALRDAAKALNVFVNAGTGPVATAYANWLFDRADAVESGGL